MKLQIINPLNILSLISIFLVYNAKSDDNDGKESAEFNKLHNFIDNAKKVTTEKELVDKVLLPLLEKNPKNTNTLNALALAYGKLEEFDKAAQYVERSLALKEDEKSLEVAAMTYVAKKDNDKIAALIPKFEALEQISPFMLHLMIAHSEKNRDVSSFLVAVTKMDEKNLQNEKSLLYLKKAAFSLHSSLKK